MENQDILKAKRQQSIWTAILRRCSWSAWQTIIHEACLEICFVHFAKNLAHHSGINCALYSALFGTDPRCGLTSTSLQSDIVSLMTEEDLVSVLTTPVASPHPTACASSEDPTNTATRAETVTELSSGSPSNEIHPWPQKPPLTQSVKTHSFLPPEFMASGQPLATPNSKADLCLH